MLSSTARDFAIRTSISSVWSGSGSRSGERDPLEFVLLLNDALAFLQHVAFGLAGALHKCEVSSIRRTLATWPSLGRSVVCTPKAAGPAMAFPSVS